MIVDINFENPDVNVDIEDIFTMEITAVPGPKGDTGYPTDAQVTEAVASTLAEHPEWTTTLQDGAVTWEKLNTELQNELSAVRFRIEDDNSVTMIFTEVD